MQHCHALGVRLLVVNDGYRLAPFADCLYAADDDWWQLHWEQIKASGFKGQLWCTKETVKARHPEVNYIPHLVQGGLATDGFYLHTGQPAHSGYQAINLAYLLGARDLILLGYDCHARGKRHWFGEHPAPLRRGAAPQDWAPAYDTIVNSPTWPKLGLSVTNCSPGSRIAAFPKMKLLDRLRAREHGKYRDIYELDPRYRMSGARGSEAQRDILALKKGSLLDVGCGRGEIVEFAKANGFDAVGVDVVPLHHDIMQGSITALPFDDNSFDYVTSFDVLEHLLPIDTELALGELKRVARKGVLLTVNNKPSKNRVTGHELHINRRPYDEWAGLISTCVGENYQRRSGYSETFTVQL